MKKLISFIILFVTCININAQITISQTDFASIGTTLNQATDKSPGTSITPGNTGGNQVWDFSALQADTTITIHFVDPATTGSLSSNFPQANICAVINDSINPYLKSTSSSVQLLGATGDLVGNGVIAAVVYSNTETMLTFPTTFNTSFTDTSYFNQKIYYGKTYLGLNVDTVRQVEHNYITSTIDAWGTVITPDGSFPALRQNMRKITNDSTWVRVKYIGWLSAVQRVNTIDQRYYTFYTNTIGNALVNIKYYGTDSTKVDWTRVNTTSSNSLTEKEKSINIFSTIVTNKIQIYNPKNSEIKSKLFDYTGKEILSTEFENNSIINISINNLKNGFYLLNVYNKSGKIKSGKIIISK
ncbi:MAG TPA: T9SS type A sorting domain-containing protein [Bacteroidales bacterium]|nr:T9SS type A sorting domain-containing protein [Bacteroidales bacterium]HPS15782.1 T9SS type A sorting domain-containing protein [Bacteroidales bacterium]